MTSAPKPEAITAPVSIARMCAIAAGLVLQCSIGAAWAQGVLGTSPETATPVYAARGGVPLVMLTMARDHTLFFPAYNDLSDLDGDGALDIRFNPTFEYVGLYQPYYCYSYSGSGNAGVFTPVGNAIATTVSGSSVPGPCAADGTQSTTWSGNFLNYVTTSRMDALRVALYGGTRDEDTVTSTVLRRAYIPQDGHAWAKEYSSLAVDGYNISQYTPLANPSASGRRHFFGSLTSTAAVDTTKTYTYTGTDYPPVGVACANLDTCSNYPPLLRVVANSDKRVWEWASSERPVLNAIAYPTSFGGSIPSYGSGTLTDYTVRVKVCVTGYLSACKEYPNEKYKPIGVLHEFGEDQSVYFGLLTGSYDQNLSGGRLRKNIGTFTNEVEANTGIFSRPTPSIIDQIDKIRIRNFNYNAGPATEPYYYLDNFLYRNGRSDLSPYWAPTPAQSDSSEIFNNSFGDRTKATGTYHIMQEGEYADWGNPVAEMMYEGLRYFAGAAKTTAYNSGVKTEDQAVGLASVDWVDPYVTTNWCAKPSQMVISSVNPSFDSDQLPGNAFGGTVGNTLTATGGASLDVAALTNTIGATEGINGTSRFIGEVTGKTDGAPTLKAIVALGSARGLPPDDTNKKGSYYAAAVANFGKTNSLRNVGGKAIPNVDTFAVLMNKPIPEIVIPFAGGKKITIVPFARTIDAKDAAKYSFQPTNQIVGMYITSFENPDNNNGTGGYRLKFAINYEDRSWGGDFDMDVIAEYDIHATDSKSVTITVKPTYGASGSKQNIGYVITGTGTSTDPDTDGPYLVVQNKDESAPYYLNVPPSRSANYCDQEEAIPADCNTLPNLPKWESSTKSFKVASTTASNYLKDPLWYAAKWGGYSGDSAPTTAGGDDPDNYAQVTSPAKLRAAFAKTFEAILNRSSTVGAVSASSSQLLTETKLFQASFNQKYFFGDLKASTFSVTKGTGTNNDVSSYAQAWTAAQKLTSTASSDRNIYYKSKTGADLKPFSWSNNIATDYTNASLTSDIVSYLRGDQTKETWQSGGSYRSRRTTVTVDGVTTNVDNVLGGIINSGPFYSDDTKTVYVGANDGMLHAFNSETGDERFAFIPSAVISNLYKLSDPTFSHRYYVDGQIAVSSKNDTGGVNYLVGFMGRGAKGLYGLQVGNTSSNSYSTGVKTTGGAWENFGVGDSDMGYLLGKPLIEKLQDGTDVVIFGNGYNSDDNEATLYVVNLKTGFVIAQYRTRQGTDANPNGLATPVVTRKNGKVEYAYAGDYHGHVWKFNLSNLVPSGTTQRIGRFLFPNLIYSIHRAKDSSGNIQTITAPLATGLIYNNEPKNPKTERFVFFGTGSDLTIQHANSTAQNSMYGLIDKNSFIGVRGTYLTARTIDTATGTYTGYSRNASVGVRSFSTWVKDDMKNKYGWYMDWTTPSGSSEKVVSAPAVRNTVTPTLVVSSNIFSSNSCNSNGQGFLNAMDAYHGGGLTESYFDINRDRSFSDETFTGANSEDKVISSVDLGIGNIGQGGFPGDNVVVQGGEGPGDSGTKGSKTSSSRISWREIVK